MTHTPGPWIVMPAQWDAGKTLCIQTESIGDVVALIEGPTHESDRDNATLMAAAPDMRAALEEVSAWINCQESMRGCGHAAYEVELRKIVAAALAKAG